MSDSPSRANELARELCGRLTVAGALIVALVSLLQHSPLWLACLRGVGTLVVLGLGTRLGVAALDRAIHSDRSREQSKREQKP
jgi:hypothetical protein